MYTFLLILFIINSIALMLVVLMQSSKGGGLGGAFGGGGGSQVIFGGRGAGTFLTKAAAYLGGAFFVLAIALSIVSARGRTRDSKIQDELANIAGQLTNPGVPVSSALNIFDADTSGIEDSETSGTEEFPEGTDSPAAE